MNSQAGSRYLDGPCSASSAAVKRYDVTRRSRSYRQRSSRSLRRASTGARPGGRGVVPLATAERNRVVRELIAATAQTLGYLALTALAVWLAFTYVP